MHLLTSQPVRLLLPVIAAALLLCGSARGQDEPAAPPTGGDPAVGNDNASGEPAPEPEEVELPDIRRRPPRTDEEEQRYKLFKFQTDPFLAPPPPRAGQPSYNPLDWLVPCSSRDFGTYLVQDSGGTVIGNLSLAVEQVDGGPAGPLVQLTQTFDYGDARQTITQLRPETLAPVGYRHWEQQTAATGEPAAGGAPPGGQLVLLDATPSFFADYEYDRVNVEQNTNGFISRGRFRQLPNAFDQSSLPLLVRQLDFRYPNWPFESVVTDPLRQASHQLSIAKPNRVTTMSAEPRTYNCFELVAQLDTEKSRWWVERIPPYRLVKFTLGGLTYTLVQQVEQQ